MRLDARDSFPSGMKEYLAQNGWHFSKKMFEWVSSMMYKKEPNGRKVKVQILSKENVDELLKRYGITLENKFGYDYVFAANMCKADYLGSSVPDEQHLALFVKDYVDIQNFRSLDSIVIVLEMESRLIERI